jgi:hypothetical protein
MYVDANNLYGGALSQKLPVGNFDYLQEPDLIDWANIDTEGRIGYALEVDLEYPAEIHDTTQFFPLAAENLEITHEMLTYKMKATNSEINLLRARRETAEMTKCRKLVGTCMDKKNYVVHFKILKFYLQKGLRITKIHQCVKFEQEEIYREFIDTQTERRAAAKNDFEKMFYKQKNNSLYGKSMENMRERLKVKLVGDAYHYVEQATKPTFSGVVILKHDLALMSHTNAKVKLKSTIAIGATVLDLSKLTMYDLVYNKFPQYERDFGCRLEVIGGDTDSFFVMVKGAVSLERELYPAMIRDELLDTSNYPKTHPLYSDRLNSRLGCIKDEMKGVEIKEVVMLAPKCYSFEQVDGQTKHTAKGVGKAIKKSLTHRDYKDRYRLRNELKKEVKRMQSFKHVIFNVTQNKIALSFFENKRAWVGKNFSLPYGHHMIPLYEAVEIEKVARRGTGCGGGSKPNDLLQSEKNSYGDIDMLIRLLEDV